MSNLWVYLSIPTYDAFTRFPSLVQNFVVTYVCRKLINTVSNKTMLVSHYFLFQFNISYAILAQGHKMRSSAALCIFALQRQAVRILTDLTFTQNCRFLFSRVKIMTFPLLYICLQNVHKNFAYYASHYQVHNTHYKNKIC